MAETLCCLVVVYVRTLIFRGEREQDVSDASYSCLVEMAHKNALVWIQMIDDFLFDQTISPEDPIQFIQGRKTTFISEQHSNITGWF